MPAKNEDPSLVEDSEPNLEMQSQLSTVPYQLCLLSLLNVMPLQA